MLKEEAVVVDDDDGPSLLVEEDPSNLDESVEPFRTGVRIDGHLSTGVACAAAVVVVVVA